MTSDDAPLSEPVPHTGVDRLLDSMRPHGRWGRIALMQRIVRAADTMLFRPSGFEKSETLAWTLKDQKGRSDIDL